jgi:hypothetical protein
MKKKKRLTDAYRIPGFKPKQILTGVFGDPKARIIKFNRIEKKHVAQIAVENIMVTMTEKSVASEIFPVETLGFSSNWRSVASNAGAAGK